MNADDVARYLREHPDFMSEHGEIFAEITVPHPHGGQAITLAERQLHALRDKIRQLEVKLAELIRFGEENDEIGEKMHRLGLALLEADGYELVRHALLRGLQDDFAVPHVALRLWNSVLSRDGEDFSEVGEGVRFFFGDLTGPYCGAPTNLEILQWLGEAGPHIRSVALIPLRRDERVWGALVLGSEEVERFYPGMGTLFLSRLGELVSAVLRRELG